MEALFQSTSIGKMSVGNRFLRSATAEGLADDGAVTEQLIDLYRELARNEVGMIMTGFVFVSRKGQSLLNMLGAEDDGRIAGLKKLTSAVHGEGGKIIAQLVHAGANRYFDPGFPAQGPSASIADRTTQVEPVAMSQQDIQTSIRNFADAAKMALDSGFDGVQIHAAHGYLLSQFLSPYSNQRDDNYGGSIENRARIIFEIYKAIREEVGQDYPVLIKVNAKDYFDVGLEWKDSLWVCRELAALGIDAIELSAIGGPEFLQMFSDIDSPQREAYLEAFAKELKTEVKCPVILVGGLRSLGVVERLYNSGVADFFSMARPLISEPGLISRWQSGETKKARCISCNKCLLTVLGGGVMRCYNFEGAD